MRGDFMLSIGKKIDFTKRLLARIGVKGLVKIILSSKLRRHQQSHLYINPKYGVAYYALPKVLSSTLCQLMLKDAGIAFEDGLGHEKHRECFDYRLSDGEIVGFTFGFVRNPFARLVSLYKDKVVRKRKRQKPSPFDHYLGGLLMEASSFAEFSSWIYQISDDLAEPHFVSQHSVLSCPSGSIKLDFIGKLESVDKDWAYIQEKTGLPDLGHFNQTPKDDWRDYYDLKTAELVYQRYQKDIEAFDYEEAYQDLLAYLRAKE